MRSIVLRMALAALLVGSGGACLKYVATPAPDAPPARPFDETKVHGAMGEIALRVRAVEGILREGSPGPEGRIEVERLLEELDREASKLSVESVRGSHPALARNLDGFLADIRMARRAAAADPPDYFLAGTLSGACAACHGTVAGAVRGRSVR